MKIVSALVLTLSLAAAAQASDFADLQGLKASAISKINPFPDPGNPDSCYLLGMQDGLCRFKCRSGETFQVKPVKPQAASVYEKCGGGDYRGAQPPDAGAIWAQINQQNNQPQQPIIPPAMQFALEAASELRKDLKGHGIKAKVGLVNRPGGAYGLWAEFLSLADYEKVKDMFYQDPGDNPSYMDLKVEVRIAKAAETAADKKIKSCWLKDMEKDTCIYKCSDGSAHTQPIQRPSPWSDQPVIACPQLVFPF